MPKITYVLMALAIMVGGFLTSGTVVAKDMPLINGDFEATDLTGWTPFTTTNGTLGPGYPQVVLFDTNNDGTPTSSAQFSVGQASNAGETTDNVWEGGGIYQTVHLAEGEYLITADIAVAFGIPQQGIATPGGLFELLVDDVVVANHNFGDVYKNTTQHSLLASVPVYSTSYHEIRFRITRPGTPAAELHQYIDNVLLSGGPESTDPPPSDSKPGKDKSSQSTDAPQKNCNYQAGKDGSNKGGSTDTTCTAGKK